MLRPEIVEQLKELLPEDLRGKAMVAGGYAADPEKAGDIDLWVVGMADLDKTERHIRQYLAKIGRMEDYSAEHAAEYEGGTSDFRVVAEASIVDLVDFKFSDPKVQILITSQPTFLALLNRFDISVHQIGFSLADPQVAILAPTYTTPAEQIRITNFERPEQTLRRRVERIYSRYNQKLDLGDLVKLARASEQLNAGFEEDLDWPAPARRAA